MLFVANGIAFLGQFMMSTLLPKYLNSMELSSTVIGVVIALFSVTALGSRPVIGPLIDGWDKVKLYRLSLFFLLFSFLGYAVARSVVLLSVLRLTHGVGLGCFAALALTMASDALPQDKLASGLGIYGLSSVLATAVGPGIGLAISERFGYPAAFLLSAVLVVVALVLSLRMRSGAKPQGKIRFRLDNIVSREALMPGFLLLLACIARAGITTFLVVLITDVRGIPGISTYYVINALAMVASRPLTGHLSDKLGLHVTLMLSYVMFAANLVAVAFCQSTWVLYLAAVLNAFGIGATSPAAQAMCIKLVKPERRGAASNTSFIGTDIGDLLGPIICGALVDAISYEAMYLLSIVPVILSAVVLIPWVRKHREQIVPVRK